MKDKKGEKLGKVEVNRRRIGEGRKTRKTPFEPSLINLKANITFT